jgi:hypothetical protein
MAAPVTGYKPIILPDGRPGTEVHYADGVVSVVDANHQPVQPQGQSASPQAQPSPQGAPPPASMAPMGQPRQPVQLAPMGGTSAPAPVSNKIYGPSGWAGDGASGVYGGAFASPGMTQQAPSAAEISPAAMYQRKFNEKGHVIDQAAAAGGNTRSTIAAMRNRILGSMGGGGGGGGGGGFASFDQGVSSAGTPDVNYNALNKAAVANAQYAAAMARYNQELAQGTMFNARIAASPLDPRVVGVRQSLATRDSAQDAYTLAQQATKFAKKAAAATKKAY